MNVACQYCGNRWFLTADALQLAVEASPQKGRSVGVECPRCRKLVKVARPKSQRSRPAPPESANVDSEPRDADSEPPHADSEPPHADSEPQAADQGE